MSNKKVHKSKQERQRTAVRMMCLILAIAMLGGVVIYLFILIGGGF